MTRLIAAVCVWFIMVAPCMYAQATPDLAGDWILDKAASVLTVQQFKTIDTGSLQITRALTAWQFKRTFTTRGTDDTIVYTLGADDREIEGSEDGMKTFSRSSWQGSELVYITRYVTPHGEATNTVHYSLLENGRVLQARETFRGPRLQYDNIWKFNKK